MTSKYPHLSDRTSELADADAKERMRAIKAGIAVIYDRAKEVLARMEDLLDHPPIDRMPNMLIVADSNNGKTWLLRHFLEKHPPDPNPSGDAAIVPVVMVNAPPTPDIGELCASILTEVNAPYRESANDFDRMNAVKRVLQGISTRMLIIDEIHDMLTGSAKKQRELRNAIKGLGNYLKISIVAAGIDEAYTVFSTDPQLSNRFYPEPLPLWKLDANLGRLLASIERKLPLRRPSNLKAPEMLQQISFMSEGTIGGIYEVLKMAASKAIANGSECISLELLYGLSWTKPSERKSRPALA